MPYLKVTIAPVALKNHLVNRLCKEELGKIKCY